MRTIDEVEKVVGENWRDTPPQYDNLTSNKTMEWFLFQELKDVMEELNVLRELTKKIDLDFYYNLQNGNIKNWDDVAKIFDEWNEAMENGLQGLVERFL